MSFFAPVNSILRKYHEKHDIRNVPIKVDYLRPLFEELGYVDRIIWEKFNFQSEFLLAQIKTYQKDMGVYTGIGDYARIQISEGQNYCWTRFILCKEMFHVILDEEKNNRVVSSDDLLKLSDYFTNSFLKRIAGDEVPFAPYETELDAEVMALETLFPYELRRSYCDKYDSGTVTAHQLALRYRLPVEYIETSMVASYFSSVAQGRDLIKI